MARNWRSNDDIDQTVSLSVLLPSTPRLYLTYFISLLPFYLFLLSFWSLSAFASCLHTHKMEGSGEAPIQNSFVELPAPYPLSSCRGDPGEPYHSSICKCPCTWTTAWACWDRELIYANLRETVTAHNTEPATDTGGRISPPAHQRVAKTMEKWKIWTKLQERELGVTESER